MNIELEKNNIRQQIAEYFGSLYMTKCKHQIDNGYNYGIYYAKIGCMLCIDNQYVVITVPNDNNRIGTMLPLSDLSWNTFQTRTIKKLPVNIKLTAQTPTKKINDILNSGISIAEKLQDRYVYYCNEYPLYIELLSNGKDEISYNDKGKVLTAIETYNCVIHFQV